MTKVLSFSEYIQKANEADLFGVKTSAAGNLPSGFINRNPAEIEDLRGIDPSRHELKIIATDESEFAILEDKNGKKYVYYFDASEPEFQENYLIYNEDSEEYEEPDDLGIEAAANEVPESAYGIGLEDWENSSKEIIELDEELTDDLIDQFENWVRSHPKKKVVYEVLKSIASELLNSNESEEYDDESEEDHMMEGEGIHPAVRQRLLDYLKDNPDATYPEAKKYISEKIAGWKLTQEDFEEAKAMM
jgi:hypothetical protein